MDLPLSPPPSPEELTASAARVMSHALCVSATRLIQESQHLRESTSRTVEEAERVSKEVALPTHPPRA